MEVGDLDQSNRGQEMASPRKSRKKGKKQQQQQLLLQNWEDHGQGQEIASPKAPKSFIKKEKKQDQQHDEDPPLQQEQLQQQQQQQQQPWQEWQDLIEAEPEGIETYTPNIKTQTDEISHETSPLNKTFPPPKSILKSPRSAAVTSDLSAASTNNITSGSKFRNVQFEGVHENDTETQTKTGVMEKERPVPKTKLAAINPSTSSMKLEGKTMPLAPIETLKKPQSNSGLSGQPLGKISANQGQQIQQLGQPSQKLGQLMPKLCQPNQNVGQRASLAPVVAPLQAPKPSGSSVEGLSPLRREINSVEASLLSRKGNHQQDDGRAQSSKFPVSKVRSSGLSSMITSSHHPQPE